MQIRKLNYCTRDGNPVNDNSLDTQVARAFEFRLCYVLLYGSDYNYPDMWDCCICTPEQYTCAWGNTGGLLLFSASIKEIKELIQKDFEARVLSCLE